MTQQPFFSIITITLNSEKYLAEAIESVISQDYPFKEHIIIDGGSTDDTLNILKSYGDNVKWISEKDDGIADAMNKGINISNGEIIACLHSDDRYKSGALSKASQVFQDNLGVMWLCGNGEFIDKFGNVIKPIRFKKYSYKKLKSHNFIVHPSVFIRKDVFEKVGFFNTSFKYAMDYDMWLRIGKNYKPIQTMDTLSSFRLHDASLSTFESIKAHDEEQHIRLVHYETETKIERCYHFLRYKIVRFFKSFKPFRGY